MARLLVTLIAAAAAVAAAWFLAALPGTVSVSVGPYSVQTSAPVAVIGLIVLVVALSVLLRILVGVWTIPGTSARWRRGMRLRAGERAVNRVLLALAAGEQEPARKNAQKARRLLGDTPQTLLLLAEASRMSGKEQDAQEAYLALAERKDGRFLGLRGLLRQAIDRGDWAEAADIAKKAEQTHPGSLWLREQRTELALQTEQWGDALQLVGPGPKRTTYYVAAANAEADPAKSMKLARQAWKEDPGFAPAALAYARRLREAGHESRARATVQEAWAKAPHPELAEFFLAKTTDKLARVQVAKQLTERNPAHAESRLLTAQVTMAAGLLAEARRQIDLARAAGLNQRRLNLLTADLEEQERGDTEAGRAAQRAALRQAAAAEPDPTWRCEDCHGDQVAWHPKCAFCGHAGTLHWVASAASRQVPAVLT